MCINAPTSLATFGISMASAVALILRGIQTANPIDIFQAVVVALIGAMQGIEYRAWKHQTCDFINFRFSHDILRLLTLQVILTPLVFLFFFPKMISVTLVLSLIMAIFLVSSQIEKQLESHPSCTKPKEKGGRLVWGTFRYLPETTKGQTLLILFGILQQALFFLTLTSIPGQWNHPIRTLFLPITLFATLAFTFKNKSFFDENVFGSIWCFLAVGLGPIVLSNL